MARPVSKLAPGWWDYTTLEKDILEDAARLTAKDRAHRPADWKAVTADLRRVAMRHAPAAMPPPGCSQGRPTPP